MSFGNEHSRARDDRRHPVSLYIYVEDIDSFARKQLVRA